MFARLARLMGEDQPFYGLQARGVDNYEEPFESVTEMASQYLSEIRMVQPLGPYFIGGTCTGGVVAYEMAQQLLSQGETVALAIMDSSHPSSEAGYLKFTSSFWRLGHFTSRATTYVRELRKLSVTDWLGFLRTKLGNATNGMRSSNNRSHEKTDFQIRAIYRKNMQAVARYSVKEYPGTLLNIVASKRLIGSGIVDTRRCWDSLAMDGGRAEFIAAIDSGQLFVTPHVEVLARLLAEFSEELAK